MTVLANLHLVLGDRVSTQETITYISGAIASDPDDHKGLEIRMVITEGALTDFLSGNRDSLCEWIVKKGAA